MRDRRASSVSARKVPCRLTGLTGSSVVCSRDPCVGARVSRWWTRHAFGACARANPGGIGPTGKRTQWRCGQNSRPQGESGLEPAVRSIPHHYPDVCHPAVKWITTDGSPTPKRAPLSLPPSHTNTLSLSLTSPGTVHGPLSNQLSRGPPFSLSPKMSPSLIWCIFCAHN